MATSRQACETLAMGTCYYLVRRDTRTVYDLGKAYFLHHAFGDVPLCVTADDVDTLVSLILAAERGDLDGAHDVSLHRGPDAHDEHWAYWRAVALDVVDWSEGQPFEFHSEHSGLIEDIHMEGWDHDPKRERLYTTGDRHDNVAVAADGTVTRWERPSREDLARRRRDDEAFRRGNVWVDWRTRTETVQTTSAPRLRS